MHAPAAWARGMDAVLRDADALLRRGPIPGQRGGRRAVLVVLLLAPLYGLCMGSYSVTSPDRLLMPVLIAAKMPILVLATAAICLPGFFVLYAAAGLASDFREALRAVAAGQAGVAAALASFGPVILVAYSGVDRQPDAVLLNALVFTVAAGVGQAVTWRGYRPLIARSRRHGVLLAAWLALYAFVGIQMGWTLRPFIGDPDKPVQLFRDEPLSNAYVVVFRLFRSRLGL